MLEFVSHNKWHHSGFRYNQPRCNKLDRTVLNYNLLRSRDFHSYHSQHWSNTSVCGPWLLSKAASHDFPVDWLPKRIEIVEWKTQWLSTDCWHRCLILNIFFIYEFYTDWIMPAQWFAKNYASKKMYVFYCFLTSVLRLSIRQCD